MRASICKKNFNAVVEKMIIGFLGVLDPRIAKMGLII
jgi:hypothetical protein